MLAKDDQLVEYGDNEPRERLLRHLHEWVELGMPTAASFALRIYPRDAPVAACRKQWLVTRSESRFLW